jgi:hypothetical protein
MAMREAGRFHSAFEAELAQGVLAAAGIDSLLLDREMAWSGLGLLIPVRLMVIEDDLAAATALLEEAEG